MRPNLRRRSLHRFEQSLHRFWGQPKRDSVYARYGGQSRAVSLAREVYAHSQSRSASARETRCPAGGRWAADADRATGGRCRVRRRRTPPARRWCPLLRRRSGAAGRSIERNRGSAAAIPGVSAHPGASRAPRRRGPATAVPILGQHHHRAFRPCVRDAPAVGLALHRRSSRCRPCVYIPPDDDVDHPRAIARRSVRAQQACARPFGQRERAEHHGGERHLEAVGREPALRDDAARVVHEDVRAVVHAIGISSTVAARTEARSLRSAT